jgi:hypothetical protein
MARTAMMAVALTGAHASAPHAPDYKITSMTHEKNRCSKTGLKTLFSSTDEIFVIQSGAETVACTTESLPSPPVLDAQPDLPASQIAYRRICTSTASTLTSTLLTYPLDKKKLFEQANRPLSGGYYKGIGPYTLAMCLATAGTLPVYQAMRDDKPGGTSGMSPLGAGLVSGALGSFLSNPAWVYRTRMTLSSQANGVEYDFKCFTRDVMGDPRILFHGLAMSTLHAAGVGVSFVAYENLKAVFDQNFHLDENPAGELVNEMVSGSSARIIASLISFPALTVQVKRQETGKSYPEILSELKSQGLGRFYAGFSTAIKKTSASALIYFGVYHLLEQFYIDETGPTDTPASDS